MAITDDIRIKDLATSTQIHDGDWLVKDNASDGTKKISPSTLKAWINDGMATVEELETAVGNIADTYNTSESYVVDDLCIHEYALYKCIGATTGTWDSTKWQATTIAEIIATIDLNAEAISYDNTSSGLEADNVQDAIGETITKLSAVGSARGDIATFTDGSDLPMPKLEVAIEPQQDLHGYDAPWVGGAGKNKYEGSPLFDEYVDKNKWTLQAEKYNGHDVYKKSTAWGGMYKLTYLDVGTYTFSCMCKTSDADTAFIFLKIDNVTTAITDVTQISNATSTSWTKISGTFNVTSAGTVALRVERSSDNGDIYISEYQLESGSTPTSYAPYSNICPISGWDEVNVIKTGKNLWGGEKLADDIVAKVPNATKDTTNHTVTYSASGIVDKILFRNFKENTQYSIFIDLVSGTSTNLRVLYKDGTRQGISGNIYPLITLPNKSVDCIMGIWVTGSTTINYLTSGLFEGEITVEEFVAYNGTTYTIDLDGTRYGGTLDVTSGELVVDREYVDMGSPTWRNTNGRFYYNPTDIKMYAHSEVANMLCSQYPISKYLSQADNSISSYAGYIYVRADSYGGDVTAFKQAMRGVQLVYELATPLTIQLTPTAVKSLLGMNNIWADTGDIDKAEYQRDATTIINELIARIEALENA